MSELEVVAQDLAEISTKQMQIDLLQGEQRKANA